MTDLSRSLSVSEFFRSLQGEGGRAGRICTFVRLAGCNLACAWCDTTYTWKPGVFTPADRSNLTLGAICEQVAAMTPPGGLVEVTGGEPLLQPATTDLLSALCDAGYEVVLNTSGSLSVAGVEERVAIALDLKCPGSGQDAAMEWDNLSLLKPGIDEIKFVIADRTDFDWASDVCVREGLCDKYHVGFSPVTPPGWAGDLTAWPLPAELAQWILDGNCRATLQLQLHRLLWPAAIRGVEEGSVPLG